MSSRLRLLQQGELDRTVFRSLVVMLGVVVVGHGDNEDEQAEEYEKDDCESVHRVVEADRFF